MGFMLGLWADPEGCWLLGSELTTDSLNIPSAIPSDWRRTALHFALTNYMLSFLNNSLPNPAVCVR